MTKHHGPQEVHLAHSWHDGVIGLSKTKRTKNADTYGVVELEASGMGLVPGGLLSVVLDDAPCPLHESTANRLKAVLRFAATDSRARTILNGQPGLLVPDDIHYLFEVFERLATQSSNPTAVQLPKSAIGVFRRCTAELKNKQTIADVAFRSAIPNSEHQTRCLSEFQDDCIEDERFRPPLHVCIAGMQRERTKEFIRAHLQARKNRILDICGNILRKHRVWATELRAIKASPQPGIKKRLLTTINNGGTTGAAALEKLDATQRLYLAAQVAEKRARQEYNIAGPAKLSRFIDKNSELTQFALVDFASDLERILLADKFLPQLALTAAYLAVLTVTGWNSSTVLALTRNTVQKTKSGYVLVAVKPKIDTVQSAPISASKEQASDEISEDVDTEIEISDSVAVEALELLIVHRENIHAVAPNANESLFCTLSGESLEPSHCAVLNMTKRLANFASKFKIPSLNSVTVRKQAINLRRHIASGGIDQAQAFAGHSNLATTVQDYLNTDFNAILHEANALDFMELLAASANVVAGREDQVSEKYRQRATEGNLLFPANVLAHQAADNIADRWFAAAGQLKFDVGRKEIYHCALQRRVYRNYSRTVLEANPTRFKEVHKPRIMFNEALYQVISVSSAAGILHQYERELDAAEYRGK